MPRVFVYEYLTALGIGRDPESPEHSLYREGRAMRDAVAEDIGRLPGFEVVTLDDVAAGVEEQRFQEAAGSVEYSLVIAPESDSILESRIRLAHDVCPCVIRSSIYALRAA